MSSPQSACRASGLRQDTTKTRDDRTLILPGRVAAVLRQRMDRDPPAESDAPVFGTRVGTWLSPANMRTRLRRAISRATPTAAGSPAEIHGTSFHTLRRTVGTLLAHEVSLDAAREQLGHRDPSVTYQHYVGKRHLAPDVRTILDLLLALRALVVIAQAEMVAGVTFVLCRNRFVGSYFALIRPVSDCPA